MVNGAKQVPDGWELSTLGESCDIVLGQSPSSDTYNTEGVGLPFYQGKAEFGDLYPTPEKWCSSPKKIAKKDDILISVRAPVGPTNLCPEKSCIGRGLAAIRPKNMPTKYFLHYLRYIEKEWDSKATGTTFKAITGDVLRNQEIPLAPLPEQERIVNRIEELFSDLEAGVAALERVRAGLRRYKASVLKAAVSGRLVNGGSGVGKLGLGNRELGELPEGWRWATLEELSSDANYGISQKCDYNENEFPVIRIPNIISGNIDLGDLKFAIDNSGLREKNSLAPGDLLIIRTNGSKDLIGKSALIRKPLEKKFYFASYLIRYRIKDFENVGAWVSTIWESPYIRVWLESAVATTAGQYNLNIAKLNKLPIPLPPLDEQRRIVAEVERRLPVVGEVETAVEAGLARSARLRQSVLRSAFEGRLR